MSGFRTACRTVPSFVGRLDTQWLRSSDPWLAAVGWLLTCAGNCRACWRRVLFDLLLLACALRGARFVRVPLEGRVHPGPGCIGERAAGTPGSLVRVGLRAVRRAGGVGLLSDDLPRERAGLVGAGRGRVRVRDTARGGDCGGNREAELREHCRSPCS